MYNETLYYFTIIGIFFQVSAQIRLNEASNNNVNILKDWQDESPDWVEIFIPIGFVNGYYLSDDLKNLNKWKLPEMNLLRDSFLLIFLSGKDTLLLNEFHANFKLKQTSEILILSKANVILDSVTIPVMHSDYSFQRNSDLSWTCTSQSSPKSENTNSDESCELSNFTINPKSGFYNESIEISIQHNLGKDIEFRYTLDGSIPIITSSLFNNSVRFDTSIAIRIRAFKKSKAITEILDRVYFIREKKHSVPIISLIISPEELFSDSIGLFSFGPNASPNFPYKGANFWSDKEVPCTMDYFVNSKNVQSAKIDLGLYGGSGCRTQNMKALKLLAKEKYNSAYFNYTFFKQKPAVSQFKRLVLRNSSNDFLNAHMRDGAVHRFVLENNFSFDAVAYEPCVVYINGKYWGFYNLREKIDEYFFLGKYHLNEDEVHLIEEDSTLLAGDLKAFDSLYRYCISQSLTDQKNYDYVSSILDIPSMIDYFIVETFFNNTDWPYNNIKYWKPINGGKWKYIMIDTDAALNAYPWSHHNIDHLAKILGPYGDKNKHVLILRSLLKNSEARRFFVNRYADLLNTIFQPEVLQNSLQKTIELLEPEMPQHYEKWGGSLEHWYNIINTEILEFVNARNAYLFEFLKLDFSLSKIQKISFNTIPQKAASLQINSIAIHKFPWDGNYFAENKIDLSYIPNKQYNFSYWIVNEDTLKSDALKLLDIDGINSITAVFDEIPKNELSRILYEDDKIIFEWYATENETDKLEIYDFNGKFIQVRNVDSVMGLNNLYISTEDKPQGVYFIKYRNRSFRFIVP